MADPRELPPNKRGSNLSPLMIALGKASQGEKVNFCPYGCQDDELDDNGYCYHLIGFTNDGKKLEPMTRLESGYTCVQVPFVTKRLGPRKIKKVYQYGEVLRSDKLVRITSSARVYRDVPRPDEELLTEFLGDDEEVADESIEEEFTDAELEALAKD